MIPRFIRDRKARDARKSEEWNPATFYIIIFILIGSQAIRMLLLKNDWKAYTRSTDAKIGLLREVIERVKRGEQVDVEKLLGTGIWGRKGSGRRVRFHTFLIYAWNCALESSVLTVMCLFSPP